MSVIGAKGSALVALACCILSLLALPGCRWQVGKVPLPFPTPTPNPTPTPAPITLDADVGDAAVEESMAAKVATASADFFAAATAEASQSVAAVHEALSDAQKDSDALTSSLPEVKKSLAAAKDAYLRSEATVFFVDPDSSDELRSQPDPFGAASPGGEESALQDLQYSLSRLEVLLEGSLDSSKAADLLLEAKSIAATLDKTEAGLRDMAGAWKRENAGNFRSDYFLSSPESAVARIFQGLLALTGDLLPSALAGDRSGSNAEIVSRVAAVRDIYLGSNENSSSLHTLVQLASPVQAALARASIARAFALASVLEIAPDNESARSQLAPALEDLTRQLTFAANSLGIVVVSDE